VVKSREMDLSPLDSKLGPSDSNPHPEVRDWDKIKDFLSSNSSFAANYRTPYHEKVDAPINQFRLFVTVILAALLEPAKMRSKNPALALERAALLLERAPEYLPFESLSRVQERKLLAKWAAEKKQLVHDWKMDEGDRFTLERFIDIERAECRHKSPRELRAMLERVDFPFLETPKKHLSFPSFWPAGQITLEAYQLALKLDAKLQQKRKLESQRKRRAK
jgi:hypothetical protein